MKIKPELLDAISNEQAVYWNSSTYVPKEGYGYAFAKYTEALKKLGIYSIIPSDLAPELKDAIKYLIYEFTVDTGGPPVINHCLPNTYIKGTGINIGMTYWETDTVPEFWVPHMNSMDEIWTSSKFIRGVYEKQEVNNSIKDFNQGVDPEVYWMSYEAPRTDKFTFLSFGSPSERKNAQYAYNAFMDLFEGNSDYHLIVKSSGACSVRNIKNGENLGSIYNHPQVTVVDEMITDEEISALYRSVHCLVYPTSGEGWGLVPFTAIACGTPTICTNATACTEFADKSIHLNFKWEYTHQHRGGQHGLYQYGGKWAEPDQDDLREKMQSVADNYESYKSLTIAAGMGLQRTHTWDRAAAKMAMRLQEIGAVSQVHVS